MFGALTKPLSYSVLVVYTDLSLLSPSSLAAGNWSDHFCHQCWGEDSILWLLCTHMGKKSIGRITSIINIPAATLGLYSTVSVSDTGP